MILIIFLLYSCKLVGFPSSAPWPLHFVPRYTIRSGLLEAEGLKPSYAPQTPQSRTAVEQVPAAQLAALTFGPLRMWCLNVF